MFESADVSSTRLTDQIRKATDPATILSLTREFAQFKFRNSPRDYDLDETPEGIVIDKVSSLDPESALQGLADIATLSAPEDHEPMNHGSRLSVNAALQWGILLSTSPLEPEKKAAHAFDIMENGTNPDLRRVAATGLLEQARKLAPDVARPFVKAALDFSTRDNNGFILDDADQANEVLPAAPAPTRKPS